jgi:hypothetical protein
MPPPNFPKHASFCAYHLRSNQRKQQLEYPPAHNAQEHAHDNSMAYRTPLSLASKETDSICRLLLSCLPIVRGMIFCQRSYYASLTIPACHACGSPRLSSPIFSRYCTFDFFSGDGLLFAREVIFLCQEEHTVALLHTCLQSLQVAESCIP